MTHPQELAAFIEKTVSYDFEPVPNPGLLRQASDIAVLGRVASVESTLLDTDAEDTGGVLISLTVDEEWKADPARTSELVTSATSLAAATCARPTRAVFLERMNVLVDLPMGEFIQRKTNQTPCFIDWSDDGCSHSPNSGSYFNFTRSCQRHDFGYRNSKRIESWYGANGWSPHNKAVADTAFRRDMTNHCWTREEWEVAPCMDRKDNYYQVVSSYGWDTTGIFRYVFKIV